MNKLTRRSMLRRSSGLAGVAASFMPLEKAIAQEKRPAPDRKLRVVAVGGHPDDPPSCAGGTLTLYADQGHDVTGLTLTGGPPPPPDANPEDPHVRDRRNAMRWAEILKIRLDCLSYKGSNSGQSKLPMVYPSVWPLHDLMRQMRGHEHGCKVAEAFNHHPQSPSYPALP